MSSASPTIPAARATTPPGIRASIQVAGVAVTSFAALLMELALTRLFSVVLFYHFAFLAISIALLGLGAGGVFAYLGKRWLARWPTRPLLTWLSLANSLTVPVVLQVVLHVPVSLELSWMNFLRLTAMYLASAVPFFLTGLELALVFARESAHIPRLYGADLVGGSLACLATVPLLNWLGGPNTILFSALMSAVGAGIWSTTSRARNLALGFASLLALLVADNRSGKLFDVIYAKGRFRDPSWVEFARWNAISRVEVDRQSDEKVVVIDADASTYIMNADPEQWEDSDWQRDLMSAPPALVNVLRPRGTYAIIGPGGGVDVLRALANGSPSVTGIEINPIIANTVMQDRYADFSYHLYQRPEVHIEIADGRSFLRNAQRRFDVIEMTLVDTWASTAAGAFALSENTLYTVEAFRTYFDHLSADGMLAITRWEFRQPREALRVVSVALEALRELGVMRSAGNFMVIANGELDEDGIPVAVLAKKTPFTLEEEHAVQQHLRKYPTLRALYLPSQPEANPFAWLIQSPDPAAFAEHYPYNVAPVRDNAPFFFFTLKLGQVLARGNPEQGIDWKVNIGVVVLVMVLGISLAAVLAFLILPMALRGMRRSQPTTPLLYFVAVGLGYMLVEIAFIQRFVLFLGHPTYALTVVVFLMLLSSGLGSVVSRRWPPAAPTAWIPLVLVAVALVLYALGLTPIFNRFVGSPILLKLAISAALLVPLGFAMGMPFPSGLRAVARKGGSLPSAETQGNGNALEWAWAMNAGSSVLGSVLAIFIAIRFGLNATLACGAAAYLSAVLPLRSLMIFD
jgi:spermidine synthase